MKAALFSLTVLAAAAAACSQQSDATNVAAAPSADASCAPLDMNKAALLELRANEFAAEGDFSHDAFALALVDCLGDPDPVLRDQVAYEGFATMLRGQLVSGDTIRALDETLRAALTEPDPRGFRRPFAALALSEVARADRVDDVFTGEERDRLVAAAADYVASVKDYRGFSNEDGWRHGVAHGADLLMQLTLNEAMTREHLVRIREAVAAQITPSEHAYVNGEGARLARPILFMALHEAFTEEDWTGWFETVSAAVAQGENFEFSEAFLARQHNLKAFASSIYINATASANPAYKILLPGAEAALNASG